MSSKHPMLEATLDTYHNFACWRKATFLTNSFLDFELCRGCSIPVGLPGGVEHSRLKRVGEWLLLNRGLNPATARAWRKRERRKSVGDEQRGGGGIIAGMVLTVYNLFMCIYVEEDSRKTSTWWCTRCKGTAVFWETSGLDCLLRHSRWKDDLRPNAWIHTHTHTTIMQTHVKIGKIQKWRHCIKLHVWLLTQRSGAEEDSPGRLPPSASSSVFYLFSSLHGSQLLTCVIMIHQPNEHTQEELMKDPPPNLLQCRDKSQIIAVCVCVSVVHVRGERVVVLMVLPVVGVALIVRLLCWPLASSDDRQTAVTWVRAANEQTSTQPETNKQKKTNKMNINTDHRQSNR